MGAIRNAHGHIAAVIGFIVTAAMGPSACVKDDIPACPGQCFQYTVEYTKEEICTDGSGGFFTISFTGSNPDGYYGRYCSNAEANVLVADGPPFSPTPPAPPP